MQEKDEKLAKSMKICYNINHRKFAFVPAGAPKYGRIEIYGNRLYNLYII